MGAKGSVEAAKLNASEWGHLEVCIVGILFCCILSSMHSHSTNFNSIHTLIPLPKKEDSSIAHFDCI